MGSTLDQQALHEVESFLDRVARDVPLPGVSVAITDATETRYATGIGSRDLADNDPATADTVYGIGSCTKSFVALAVLQLVDDGRVTTDDAVVDHLDLDLPPAVTLHHLLTHTSGYPSLGVSEALIARQAGLGEPGVPLGDWDDFDRHVGGAGEEIAAAPGERFAYCNTGYALLGRVIEAVDGRPVGRYVTEELLDPLGMERSTFDAETFRAFEDRMTPYWLADGEPESASLPVRELSAAPGGLLSSVTDLTAYLRLFLNDGVHEGTRLVSEAGLDNMTDGHVDTPDGPYGYGLRTRERGGVELLGHSGSIGVASAYVGVAREADLGIALAANASPEFPLAVVGEGILAILLGEDPETVPYFERQRRYDRLTGEYESYRGIRTATVREDGGLLRLEFEDAFGGSVPLVPVDGVGTGDEFEAITASGNRRRVRFETDGDDVSCLYERWRLHKR